MPDMERRPLKVGLILPHWTGAMEGATPHGADLLAMARLAEAVGFDSIWTVDELVWRFEEGSPLPSGNAGPCSQPSPPPRHVPRSGHS